MRRTNNPKSIRKSGRTWAAVLGAGFTVSDDVDNDTCIMLLSNVYHNERF
jgi:hypothetical protein